MYKILYRNSQRTNTSRVHYAGILANAMGTFIIVYSGKHSNLKNILNGRNFELRNIKPSDI